MRRALVILASSAHLEAVDRPFSLEGLPRISNFVPRPEQMDELKAYFRKPRSVKRRVFILHGTGGMGKSSLCAYFASQCRKEFSAVMWVDGSSRESLQASLARIAKRFLDIIVVNESSGTIVGVSGEARETRPRFDHREAGRKLLAWLSEPENTEWLFILDNLDRNWQAGKDPQAYNYEEFIPYLDHGNILITTRLELLHSHGRSMRLDKMGKEQAHAVLLQHAGRPLEGSVTITTVKRMLTS